jgi:hypothetical protein
MVDFPAKGVVGLNLWPFAAKAEGRRGHPPGIARRAMGRDMGGTDGGNPSGRSAEGIATVVATTGAAEGADGGWAPLRPNATGLERRWGHRTDGEGGKM